MLIIKVSQQLQIGSLSFVGFSLAQMFAVQCEVVDTLSPAAVQLLYGAA